MSLSEPSFLVFSGQGFGAGIEHHIVKTPFSLGQEDFPRNQLIERWASLPTEIIPQDPDELVLLIARFADESGFPWVYISEYGKANLRGQSRANHYSGVGFAVRAKIVPPDVLSILNSLHNAMVRDIVPHGEFVQSVREWPFDDSVFSEISKLDFSALKPGFSGIQPGISRARISYDRDVSTCIRETQTSDIYLDVSAVALNSKGSGGAKETYFSNEAKMDRWLALQKPPQMAPSLVNNPAPSTLSSQDDNLFKSNRKKTDDFGQLKKQVELLEKRLETYRSEVRSQKVINENRPAVSSLPLWVIAIFTGILALIAGITSWRSTPPRPEPLSSQIDAALHPQSSSASAPRPEPEGDNMLPEQARDLSNDQ